MRSFNGVTVEFPGGGGGGAQLQWQSVHWVPWGTGELRVDSSSFALIFIPAGIRSGGLSGLPLGCLRAAARTAPPEQGASTPFVVQTNDAVHTMLRMIFRSAADEDTFSVMAQAAEAVVSNRYFGGIGRQSSIRQTMAPSEGRRGDPLVEQLRRIHKGALPFPPLVYTGCELYGPDPHGDAGSEVLLGRGAVALLDSVDTNRVGIYELVFYDDAATQMLRVPIGPRTRIQQQHEDQMSRLSIGSRLSMAGTGQGSVTFEFSAYGHDSLALRFDDESDGLDFVRDVSVRHRLASMSLKTARGLTAVQGLRGELLFLQSNGLVACCRRWLLQAFCFVAVLVLARAAVLYTADPEQPPLDVLQGAFADAMSVTHTAGVLAVNTGAALCQMLAKAVPISEVERCAALSDSADVRDCVIGLAAGGAFGPTS